MSSMQLSDVDLCKAPGLLDQELLFENTNFSVNSLGYLTFVPVVANTSTGPSPGTVLVDYRGLVNIAQLVIKPFYIPKTQVMDVAFILYVNRIFLFIQELAGNSFTGYSPAQNLQLNSYQYQFSFEITDVGDRFLLTPIIDTLNCKNLLQLSQTITMQFQTSYGNLPLPSPYFTFTVTYGTNPTILTTTNGLPHNFYNENYIMTLTGGLNGIILLQPYILNVVSPTSISLPVDTTAFTGNATASMYNISFQISIPIRIRQIEKLSPASNRILPTSE